MGKSPLSSPYVPRLTEGMISSYTQKTNTSYLQVAAGQRYSVLLHTLPNPTQSTYYIQLESRERPTITRSFAILNYGPRSNSSFYPPPKPVLSLPNSTVGFLDYQLHPLHASGDFPSASEVTRTVTITVHQAVRGMTIWLENHYPWTESVPTEPYLVSLYLNDGIEFPSVERAAQNGGLDPISRAFPAEIGEVVDIVLLNTGADSGGLDAHPWHAHGRHYWDLGSGNGTYNAVNNEEQWGGKEPATRDTTMLYRYATSTGNGTVEGWRAWRLRVTEPGVWMIHCHILQHMLM
jgi:L-ascorbate oxidase